jgi:adenine-specific DNA-methyltransferase
MDEPKFQNKSDYCKTQLITYLGNKRKMIPIFEKMFGDLNPKVPTSFLDGFAGSGVMSRLAKTQPFVTNLYSNDWEYYSFVLNSCFLQNMDEYTFSNIQNSINWLNSNKYNTFEENYNYIYGNYSPLCDAEIQIGERVYFTAKNAKIIDNIRNRIHKRYIDMGKSDLTNVENFYFLAPLLYEASIHNNTCGYFNSFYKHDGIGQFGGKNKNDLNRICGEIQLDYPIFYNNSNCKTQVTQQCILKALENIYVDVAYLDPPYNKHPYGTYYFLLNEIAEWNINSPVPNNFRGQTDDWKRSRFNSFTECEIVFEQMIEKCNSHTIWISYNSNGLIPTDKLEYILCKYGSVQKKEFLHPTYEKLLGQGKKFREKETPKIKELVFILKKK